MQLFSTLWQPAEITPLRIRIQANGLSTATNWLTNFMVVMVTPPGIARIGWGMYAIFGVLCAAQIPIIVSELYADLSTAKRLTHALNPSSHLHSTSSSPKQRAAPSKSSTSSGPTPTRSAPA